jgi:hypothetical protein
MGDEIWQSRRRFFDLGVRPIQIRSAIPLIKLRERNDQKRLKGFLALPKAGVGAIELQDGRSRISSQTPARNAVFTSTIVRKGTTVFFQDYTKGIRDVASRVAAP